jgi:mRNA-degrading endonuclease RelE of RelBE toxin-antitoxin system
MLTYGIDGLRQRRIMAALFVFIETRLFTWLADEALPDDELSRLQHYLNGNPEAGDIIRDSGGVRKLRWGARGRGKRGGFRIIYLLRSQQSEIWLLTLYAKSRIDGISSHVLRKIKEEIDG